MSHGSIPLENKYFRLFVDVPPLITEIGNLELLSQTMKQVKLVIDPNSIVDPNTIGSKLPAIITYFGQFIDHDLTFEDTSQLGVIQVLIETLVNLRTSWFDLDCVYGGSNQYLTEENNTKFLIARNIAGDEDLPRDATGQALIADIRNNENLIIQHIQLAFLKFHNRVIDELRLENPLLSDIDLVIEARKVVRNHYQHLLVNEFLKSIIGDETFNELFGPNFNFNNSIIYQNVPLLPIEFSGAFYRFGHSLIRNEYYLNKNIELPIFSLKKPDDMRGFRPLPAGYFIEWNLYTPTAGFNGFQVTEKISPKLSENLFQLPLDNNDSLARRNLVRGSVYSLQSGQSLARYLGFPYLSNSNPDTNLRINISDPGQVSTLTPQQIERLNLLYGEETPLWYYTLREAEVFGNGDRLGPLGGRIVGEVFFSLLKKSKESILNNGFKLQIGKSIFTLT